ncbi:MAG: hypothetical protein JRJ09_08285 [Deltaproteobacteria bacterium]|nr:hypothetical protein [Deltaproteobacteria bacterium]MBW2048510.1 hypothetical protein [Deltaproteobacteria bacterium]MBW2111916.1 hypothetical protein [Deltaproteobacteria bacterium]MBW2353659.1 hypothetical protein [Deltaproteobacteria bacterium]
MISSKFKTSMIFLVSTLLLACMHQRLPANEGKGPIIHVSRISHTFNPVYEGEELSHSFTIANEGTADLELKKVTHS